jgi:ribosomal protein S18 acetylase RimI-like enzyme
MSDEIKIRFADDRDADVLTEFNIAMARETEGKELPNGVVSAGVKTVLDNRQMGFYIIAETGGSIAGSLMITTEWSDWRNGLFWWIQSVYVKPEFRRQGVFGELYRFLKSKVKNEPNVCGFRLYVERNNITAQRAYKVLGMEETHYKVYEDLLPGE